MKLLQIFALLFLISFTFSLKEELLASRKKNNNKMKVSKDEQEKEVELFQLDENEKIEDSGIQAIMEKVDMKDLNVENKSTPKNEIKEKILLIFHGVGDDCENFDSWITFFKIKYKYDIVKCIEYGAGNSSVFGTLFNQGKTSCNLIKNDKELNGKDVDIWGLSMGGLIARYIIQDCDFGGSVKKFISYGSPQSGVQLVPKCKLGKCKLLNFLAKSLVYKSLTQKIFAPSNFYRIIGKEDKYKKYAKFLPTINNQIDHPKKDQYKKRFSSLDKLVLVEFSQDQVVQPSISSRFGYYDDKNQIIKMKDTDEYKNDLFGLKTLDEAKKIVEIESNGGHLQVGDKGDYLKIFNHLD